MRTNNRDGRDETTLCVSIRRNTALAMFIIYIVTYSKEIECCSMMIMVVLGTATAVRSNNGSSRRSDQYGSSRISALETEISGMQLKMEHLRSILDEMDENDGIY